MRTCIFCKHFWVSSGDPGYSEHTPGSAFSMYCEKRKWNFDSERTSTEDYRKILITAETCPEFEKAEDGPTNGAQP